MTINEPIRDTSLTPADILDLVADGLTYEQIVARHPKLSYKDIFEAADQGANLMRAASEVATPAEIGKLLREGRKLRAAEEPDGAKAGQRRTLEEIRGEYPRAYESWSPEEDKKVAAAYQAGQKVEDIALAHGRQPGAIRSRLAKLGLVKH